LQSSNFQPVADVLGLLETKPRPNAKDLPAIFVEVQLHASPRFSEAETHDIAHFVTTTLAHKCDTLNMVVIWGHGPQSDMRIDVFLSKTLASQIDATYSLFIEVCNKAKLRKRLIAGGITEEQVVAWINDRQNPVSVTDYVNWATVGSGQLYQFLDNALNDIKDQVVPEVGPNMTKWGTVRAVPLDHSEKLDLQNPSTE
jgi:hypothetical protein